MNTPQHNLPATKELVSLVDSRFERSLNIRLISISTSDGFDICTVKRDNIDIESDKLAAISSTLAVLGTTSSKRLTHGKNEALILESDNGNVLLLNTEYKGAEAVLMVVSNGSMTLGELRFVARRLAPQIAAIG